MLKPFFLFILITVTASYSFSQKKEMPQASYFTKLFRLKFDYFLKKDSASLNQMLHDSLVYIHSSGGMDTKADLVNGLFTTSNPYKAFKIYNERVRVIHPNTVIIHGMVEITYTDETKNSKLLVTEVYTREKKKWLLISRHANKYTK
jgi:Domain of unknown function (DUF4440)